MRILWLALVLLPLALAGVLAAGAYLWFNQYEARYAGRIYPGVSAMGLDLSELTRDEARRLLEERLAPARARAIVLTDQQSAWRFTAGQLGLELEVEPLVEQAMQVGRQGRLLERALAVWQLWQQGRVLRGVEPRFDPRSAQQVVAAIAREVDRPTIDASAALGPGYEVAVTRSQVGRWVDQAESVRRVLAALGGGADTVPLAVVEQPPVVRDEQLAPAVERARQVLSGPVSVVYGERVWSVGRDELRRMLRLERRADGSLEAVLDREPLEALARRIASEIHQDPVDARLRWADGRLEVLKPSRNGVDLEPARAVEAMLRAAFGPDRRVELPVSVVKPAVPMEERHALGIVELIERSSTSFAGSVPAKRHNIRLAAERITGVVVPPGGTFSFNQAVGPTTLEAGFRWGYAIESRSDGPKTIPSVAGGICQVATTLFHSVFWAGYPIEERYPHLYWIPAYTSRGIEGLDTTVDEAAGLDFRFINPTRNHVLVEAWTDNSDRLHFALYGTKPDWTVQVERPFKTNIRPHDPRQYEEEDPTLPYPQRIPVEAARDGFDLRLVRKVVSAEGETRTLTLVSHYQPSRNVTLVGTAGKPQPTPSPAPTTQASPPSATPGPAPEVTGGSGATPVATPPPRGQPARATPRATPTPSRGG